MPIGNTIRSMRWWRWWGKTTAKTPYVYYW